MTGANFKKIFIVSGILILPSLFYLALRTGKNNYKRLEIFGPKEVLSGNQHDTVFHTIGKFSLLDQYNKKVTDKTFDNKIYVADFFFATCKTICPDMAAQLARVQQQFLNDPEIKIISHTVNPDDDNVTILHDYAEKYRAKQDKWYFVTGEKKEIYDLARNHYFITATSGSGGEDDFIHSEKFVLIDKLKRIRGFYDGTDKEDVDRLIKEIVVLKAEKNI